MKWHAEYINSEPVDPYLGFPLWMQTQVKNRTLWAYNSFHAEYLYDYITSSIRERGRGACKYSMVVNLPQWIKSAKNRDAIAKELKNWIEQDGGGKHDK
ncbi:hypothetical protein [Persicirhabdus sediminis]|uniref:Uncharacterized protein n=1 Tax=Persicirhabdus sediminis TaxID=454144 RepID=A0A8J7MDX2_9BACT|nr:hypothetical protein [Persicirhabdus sediminis]MBK1790054.1 hypothetical protein [Persicirhabdus sediminis]